MTETDTPSWGIEPVPERLRVLGVARRAPALGEPLRLAARDRRGRVPRAAGRPVRARALAARRARRDRRRGRRRQPAARARRPDRRRRARADDGADARAARPARLVPADRAEHRAVPRLVGLRADHHRDRRERALAAGASASAGVAFWKILFGVVATGARVPRPGRVRAQVRAQVRGLDRDRVARSTSAWWSLHGQHPVALWHRRGAHAFWPGFDLVLASIISWTPLVADYTRFSRTRARRLLERRPRLLHPDDPAVRARRGDRDVAPHQRRARRC